MSLHNENEKKVTTRIAPSPTGLLHVGTVRTALFCFLYARGRGGEYIIRIEDTDRERSKKEYEDDILGNLAWLGLSGDSLYRQSERMHIYAPYLAELIERGKAYVSKEESKHTPGVKAEVVRLRNPGKTVSFRDEVRGLVTFDTAELGDFVIARSPTDPLYHFTVVVDDYEMRVSHVIRGEDHISNTPRQILIQEALEFPRPAYAHLPLILAPDRSKLSKRNSTVSIDEYRKRGYLPEAILNYMALLGWNPGGNDEIFTLEELTELFSIEGIQKGGAIFDSTKLNWFNAEHLKRYAPERQRQAIAPFIPASVRELPGYSPEKLGKIIPGLVERIAVLSDVTTLWENGELDFYFARPSLDSNTLPGKNNATKEDTRAHLEHVHTLLSTIQETDFSEEAVKNAVWEYANEKGRGAVLWPLRCALSGKEKSPDPFSIAAVIGKDETLHRIEAAIHALSS